MKIKNISISENFCIAFVLLLMISTLAIAPVNAQDFGKKILGRWYVRTDDLAGRFTTHAVQEYFLNGTMNEERQTTVRLAQKGFITSCYIIKYYSWSMSGNILFQQLLASNATVDFVAINGQDMSDSPYLNAAQEFCNENRNTLKTFQFKIIKVDEKEIIYSSLDSQGKEVIGTDLRTPYGMSKYKISKSEILKAN